jgi:uroporphyrinogen-III synthase
MLTGFTVGITADRRADEQATLFERRGATVQHGPTIRTLPMGSDGPLRQATDEVIARRPVAVVANTGLGMRSWLSAAETWGVGAELLAALGGARIYARGPKASGAVHSAGLDVAGKAPSERLSEAVELMLADLPPGGLVAVQVDGSGDTPELDRIRRHGADVVAVPVYEWTLPEDVRPALKLADAVLSRTVHAVTFTAGPAIRNWMAILADHDLDEPVRLALTSGEIVVGCVGPVCADVAVAERVAPPDLVMPTAYRLGPLVRAVADRLATTSIAVAIGGTTMTISGTSVVVDGVTQVLTSIESRLLATLAVRPGSVMSKRELAAAVWRDPDLDPHAVEVAVARLRRRLGTAGAVVTSVNRRGYALRT